MFFDTNKVKKNFKSLVTKYIVYSKLLLQPVGGANAYLLPVADAGLPRPPLSLPPPQTRQFRLAARLRPLPPLACDIMR